MEPEYWNVIPEYPNVWQNKGMLLSIEQTLHIKGFRVWSFFVYINAVLDASKFISWFNNKNACSQEYRRNECGVMTHGTNKLG